MARLIENEIAVLITQSNDIAEHVRQQDWNSVERLTEKRQMALEEFFHTPVATEYTKPVEKMIRKILEIDHSLVEFIERERKNTFNKFINLKNNSKANKTYQNVASLNFR